MVKDTQICFNTDTDVREILAGIAEEKKISLQTLVEDIVLQYLDKKGSGADDKDKRKFQRTLADIPVVVQIHFGQNETHYRTGTIMDISMGGVRIELPKHEKIDINLVQESSDIEILFRLPEQQYTLTFKCEPRRMQDTTDKVHVGAQFVEADLGSQQALHKYIM